jgi:DNA repair protein RadC
VVLHNHPSGNPEPSDDDIALTRRLVEAGRLLGTEVLDHVIIGKEPSKEEKDNKKRGSEGFISFKEKGLL